MLVRIGKAARLLGGVRFVQRLTVAIAVVRIGGRFAWCFNFLDTASKVIAVVRRTEAVFFRRLSASVVIGVRVLGNDAAARLLVLQR